MPALSRPEPAARGLLVADHGQGRRYCSGGGREDGEPGPGDHKDQCPKLIGEKRGADAVQLPPHNDGRRASERTDLRLSWPCVARCPSWREPRDAAASEARVVDLAHKTPVWSTPNAASPPFWCCNRLDELSSPCRWHALAGAERPSMTGDEEIAPPTTPAAPGSRPAGCPSDVASGRRTTAHQRLAAQPVPVQRSSRSRRKRQ